MIFEFHCDYLWEYLGIESGHKIAFHSLLHLTKNVSSVRVVRGGELPAPRPFTPGFHRVVRNGKTNTHTRSFSKAPPYPQNRAEDDVIKRHPEYRIDSFGHCLSQSLSARSFSFLWENTPSHCGISKWNSFLKALATIFRTSVWKSTILTNISLYKEFTVLRGSGWRNLIFWDIYL